MTLKDNIVKYRNKVIEGKCINLVPINNSLLEDIVRLRNTEKNKYYLNQDYTISLESQKQWYEKYLDRFDDIYWVITNKNDIVIGTIRLYDINEFSCDQGSLIIDEKYSMGMPYLLEAELLSLDFAFNILGVKEIINDDRADNKQMHSITKKMGFKFQNKIDIRGIEYNHYILKQENLNIDKYRSILDNFMER